MAPWVQKAEKKSAQGARRSAGPPRAQKNGTPARGGHDSQTVWWPVRLARGGGRPVWEPEGTCGLHEPRRRTPARETTTPRLFGSRWVWPRRWEASLGAWRCAWPPRA
ncbi:hypothetical protein HIM_03049 [Hirsutella minnesotensis 3608]|nr:hypothetical protein HIM_03049 [Hirsutella minnesotensis 3608]